MGLDMYLSKKHYVKNWQHTKPEKRHKVTVEGPTSKFIKPDQISYIETEIAYWRKANAVHNFFCNKGNMIQDNIRYEIGTKYIKDLVKRCEKILAVYKEHGIDSDRFQYIAKSLLPTTGGFFFGPLEYEDWYVQSIENTIEQLKPVVELYPDDTWFDYYASW